MPEASYHQHGSCNYQSWVGDRHINWACVRKLSHRGTGMNFTVNLIHFVLIILRIQKAASNCSLLLSSLMCCADSFFGNFTELVGL